MPSSLAHDPWGCFPRRCWQSTNLRKPMPQWHVLIAMEIKCNRKISKSFKYFKYIKIYKLSQKIGDSAATKPQASPASSEEVVTASDRICCRQRQLNYGPQSCYHRHLDRPMSWLIHQPRLQQMHLMRPETVSHFKTYPPLQSCHHQHGDSPKSPPIHQPGLQRRSLLSPESAAHCWAALDSGAVTTK